MRYVVNAPRIGHETIDGETILIDFSTGTYFSIENTGAEVWALMESGLSDSQIAEGVARRYDLPQADAEADIRRFLHKLLENELIKPRELSPDLSLGSEGGEAGATRRNYEPPDLNKFTDVQGLLLLDPIHDVDEQGWPAPKQPSS
jgi:hypothetical protein